MCVIVIQESTTNTEMCSSECCYSSTGLVHAGICWNHCCLRSMMPCDVTTQQSTKVRIQLRILSHINSIYSFSAFPGHSNGTSKSNNIGGKNGSSRFYAAHTVYPKKYAHGFCFAVLCCGYTLTDFPISIRLTSLALWQSNDCPSASKATLINTDKYFMWIHYERLHDHNKAKHKTTCAYFLGYTVYGDGCISGGCSTHTWIHFSCNTKSPFLSHTTFSMVCDMDEFSYHSLSRYV